MCQPGRVRTPQTLDLALPLLKLVADSGISPDPYLKELKLENALGQIPMRTGAGVRVTISAGR